MAGGAAQLTIFNVLMAQLFLAFYMVCNYTIIKENIRKGRRFHWKNATL